MTADQRPSIDDAGFVAELRGAISASPACALPVHDFMRMCITRYYGRGDVLGRAGDFVTAPEISQVFGELIGLWCVVVWQQMGAPAAFNLVELGPGRGTMMRDALRAMRLVPACLAAARVRLIEPSAALRKAQAETLAAGSADGARDVAWLDGVGQLETRPTVLLGNEYVDALPVHQLVRAGSGWSTRCVTAGREGLAFAASDVPVLPHDPLLATLLGVLAATARDGDVLEYRPAGDDLAAVGRLAKHGLAVLLIDYGHARSALGDTLQAVRGHRFEAPLQSPGQADLTTHVDFEMLGRQLQGLGLAVQGLASQASFLAALGISERAARLMAANPGAANAVEMAVARLMSPSGMGARFKVVGARGRGVAPLPGLPA